MIGLDPDERATREAPSPEREPTPPPRDETAEESWDDDEYEDWLFL